MATPAAVLDFWCGAPPLHTRTEWFKKSAAFDDEIRERFGALIEAALDGTLPADRDAEWDADAPSRLARILLLDQFTRNIFRDTARAFAGDALALALTRSMIDAGDDRQLPPLQRWFVYLPLEHAEDLAAQAQSVRLFGALADEDSTLKGASDYAQRHFEVIERFGRFPHRNRALGRDSTAQELVYLQQPGAGF